MTCNDDLLALGYAVEQLPETRLGFERSHLRHRGFSIKFDQSLTSLASGLALPGRLPSAMLRVAPLSQAASIHIERNASFSYRVAVRFAFKPPKTTTPTLSDRR